MTAAERAFVARLEQRAAQAAPELARRELAAYEVIREVLTERELVRAIESGQLDRLIFEILNDETLDPALARLRDRIDVTLVDAARREAQHGLPLVVRPTHFGILNPLVVQAAQAMSGPAIDTLKAEIRETVRQHVVAGLEAGVNPRTVARGVGDIIGLAPMQERAVANFRAELLAGNRAALSRALARGHLRTPSGDVLRRAGHAAGRGLTARDMGTLMRDLGRRPLTPEQVERMVRAYRRRLIAWNTESHARTIALNAQKQGQHLAWADAIRRGVVSRDQLVRTWIAVGGPTGDGRNRPEHLALHGTQVGFDDPFPNGELQPGDSTYNCRCQARVTLAVAALRRAA